MKSVKMLLCVVLVVSIVTPASAETNFVEEFLKRYTMATRSAAMSGAAPMGPVAVPLPNLSQSGPVPMTLDDAIALMLENNLDVRTNRFAPQSAILQSRILYRQFQPSIRVASTVTRSSSPSTSQIAGAAVSRSLRNDYQVGFSQAFGYGTDVSVDFNMTRQSTNSANATFNPSLSGRVTYGVVQPVLRGRGYISNMRQIRISQNNQRISEIQFEQQMINLLVQAQRAYWDLVFAGEDLRIKQTSLELANRTLEENRMKVEIGTLAPIDVVQTQTEVATRREQLLLSTYNGAQTEDQIKKLVSNQADPGMVLAKVVPVDSPRLALATTIPTAEEAIRIALENRPEMRQIQIDLQNRDIDIAFMQNARLPQLDVSGTYTHNGIGGNRIERAGFNGAATNVVPGGVRDAFGQLFSYDFSGYSLGFVLNIPLNNEAARSDLGRAELEKRLTESRLAATAQQIALEVRNAMMQVELNRARIETAQLTKTLSEQRLTAEQTKFELGTSTLRFVLEEQRNVAQTQTNELLAMTNFTKSLVDLDRAMGMTLRRNNVEIDRALSPTLASAPTASSTSGNRD